MYNPLRYIDPSGWAMKPGNSRPDNPPGLGNYHPGIYNPTDSESAWLVRLPDVDVIATSLGSNANTSSTNYTEGTKWNNNEQYSYFGITTDTGPVLYETPIGHGGGGGGNGGSSSSIVQAVGITYSVIGSIFYNNTFQVWLDKQLHFRGFDEKGGRYIGGKLKYGKATSDIFKFAGNTIGAIEEFYAIDKLIHSQSIEEGCEHFMDAFMGGMGFVPIVGTGLSLYWFTIGKTLHYNYANQVITPMIQQGDNPGLMIYQPFK